MDTMIKRADKRDLQGAQRLFRRIISTHYRPFLGEDGANSFIWDGGANQLIKENLSDLTVMIMNDVVIGIAIMKQTTIERFMIEPSFHRMGFGTKLLAHCEQKMFQKQERLVIEMFAGNYKSNAFFKKHGWCEQKRFQDEGTNQTRICYTKSQA